MCVFDYALWYVVFVSLVDFLSFVRYHRTRREEGKGWVCRGRLKGVRGTQDSIERSKDDGFFFRVEVSRLKSCIWSNGRRTRRTRTKLAFVAVITC